MSVQKETSKVWYRLSHCFKSPVDPNKRTLTQVQADLAAASTIQDDEGGHQPILSATGSGGPEDQLQLHPTAGAPEREKTERRRSTKNKESIGHIGG